MGVADQSCSHRPGSVESFPRDRFAGAMAEWIRDTGHAMRSDQEALTWAFGMLVARCEAARTGGGFPLPRDQNGYPGTGRHLCRLLDRMRWAAERSTPVRESLDRLQSLVATADMDAQLGDVSDPLESSLALALGFESLLAGWNRSLRRRWGVYFTPRPLVKYIVRGVDTLLREELSVGDGLATADTPLTIIDPACGSGVFLLGVAEHVRRTGGLADPPRRSKRVRESFADRLIGMDVMPACCVAVELLMERVLATDWSAYCGNPLEQVEFSRSLFTRGTPLECRPGDSSLQLKRLTARSHPPRSDPRGIPVVIGNPPYGSFGRRNRGSWIRDQLREYKSGLEEKKLNLDDDFVKFLRWAQFWIEQAGRGVLAMVTSNTYLSGLTHRRMRESLARTFDRIHILDLHGSLKKRERTPAGGADQNVFPIQQGVCVGLFVKSGCDRRGAGGKIYHGELWGTRDEKLAMLADAPIDAWPWTPLEPGRAMHYFVPRADADPGPYQRWPRLDQIFRHYVSGIQTKRDALFVAFTPGELAARMREFLRGARRGRFQADVPRWLQDKAAAARFDPTRIRPYLVAPFDVRWIYYDPRLLGRGRYEAMRDWDVSRGMLAFMRQTTNSHPYDHLLVTDMFVSDRMFYSAHGTPFVAPLWLERGGVRETNLAGTFLTQVGDALQLPFREDGGGPPRDFGSRDVFHWIYAVTHCPEYRRRFDAALRMDFPRIPVPRDVDQFLALTRHGRVLVEAHLSVPGRGGAEVGPGEATAGTPPAACATPQAATGFPSRDRSGPVAFHHDQDWPDPIRQDVWEFRVGGYRVLERWLRGRRPRGLSAEDRAHFRRIIAAVEETLRQMALLDAWSEQILPDV